MYVTRPGKTSLIATTTDIHFCLYMKAAPMHYRVFGHRWPGLLSQMAFADAVKPQEYISQP